MENIIEEIFFDESEFEEVEKRFSGEKYNFPVIYFPLETSNCNSIYFNTAAGKLLGDIKYITWFINTEYVVGIPSTKKEKNTFIVRKACGTGGLATSFPITLRKEKKVKSGYYKLYKCKNGIAFKRYEPIKAEES